MKTIELPVDTHAEGITELTDQVRAFCVGLGDGLLNVFAPHSTVGLALIQADEGAGQDIIEAINRLIPRTYDYHHREKSAGHGADHVLPVLVSPTLVIPVVDGAPLLGLFQHVVLIDLDQDPSDRRVRLTFVGEST